MQVLTDGEVTGKYEIMDWQKYLQAQISSSQSTDGETLCPNQMHQQYNLKDEISKMEDQPPAKNSMVITM